MIWVDRINDVFKFGNIFVVKSIKSYRDKWKTRIKIHECEFRIESLSGWNKLKKWKFFSIGHHIRRKLYELFYIVTLHHIFQIYENFYIKIYRILYIKLLYKMCLYLHTL